LKYLTFILNWLKTPYPLLFSVKSRIVSVLGFGVFTFLFLYIFRPFGISEYKNVFLLTLGFSFITLMIVFIVSFVFPRLYPPFFDEKKWTIGRMFLLIISTVILISITNWFYNYKIFNEQKEFINLPLFIVDTTLIAIFPITFYLMIYDKYTHRSKRNFYKNIKKTKANKTLILIDENNKEKLIFTIKDVIYISAQGNYVSVFLNTKEKGIKEKVLRSSLKKIENQLNDCNCFIRCHRSYIINAYWFEKVTGNAHSYYLNSPIIDYAIPVSRSFPKEKFEKLTNCT